MPEVNTTGGAFPEETPPFNEQDQAILEDRDPQEQEGDLIGGKFKSPEDLLQAYQELEKKLGDRTQETREDTQYESEDAEVQEGDIIGGVEQVPLSVEEENVILESIGGEEGLDAMAAWATDNLDADEVTAYNNEVNSGDYVRARNALQSMFFAMQQAQGYEPGLLGGRVTTSAGDVFRSVQEVEAAMNDPRYLNDTAYTRDVEEKMGRSDILTPR
tara:strand:+ start:1027 stop:1674 length:648 start_codon:yes stop_codon:yes gene_type:complete